MDPVLLARLQFALTIGFHFIFPPITIGLAWILVVVETLGWRTQKAVYEKVGKFFGELLAITFAVGVATGIVMEFQFGTNWAEYSKFVGDIFGAPLAAEGVFAFFLESSFMGLYLFGRNRVPRTIHWFSALMVAVGSTLSAFWILVANSWQQTPAGFIVQNGRAELTDFWAAVFNPSTLPRFLHTMDAALITGAFFMAGISAYLLLKAKESREARTSLTISLIAATAFSLMTLFHSGHLSSKQVQATQPTKFAALEGVNQTSDKVPLIIIGIPESDPPRIKPIIAVPGMVSFLTFGFKQKQIQGLDAFPVAELPPLFLTFASYHIMIALGLLFNGMGVLGVFLLIIKRLWAFKPYLWALVGMIPLGVVTCEFGWIAAEVGRQPWIVYNLLKTKDAASITVSAGEILFSMILFGFIYLLLGALYVFMITRRVHAHGRQLAAESEVA